MALDRRKFLKLLGLVPVVGAFAPKLFTSIGHRPLIMHTYAQGIRVPREMWEDGNHYHLNQELEAAVNSLSEMMETTHKEIGNHWRWYNEAPE
jgi:hypothetical protein